MITRPMLAARAKRENLEELTYPVLASAKIDGIRCLMHPELGPVTRSFKAVPNTHIYEALKRVAGNTRLDGELVATNTAGIVLTFNEIQSAIMSHSGQPLFKYMVFDCFRRPDEKFLERLVDVQFIVDSMNHPHIDIIHHQWAGNINELLGMIAHHREMGFEGTMIRSLDGPYKSGRSTLKQGWLIKFKQRLTARGDVIVFSAEGVVTGFEELMRNENPDERDNFDLAKRSSAKDGMVPAGTLGALILQTEWGELRVGTGFDAATRQDIWDHNMDQGEMYRDKQAAPGRDMGRTVTFEYEPYGMKDKPRFPIFVGFREDE